MIPEWLRDLRGFPAYVICALWPIEWQIGNRAFFWLLQYAGDWIYREERRELMRAKP